MCEQIDYCDDDGARIFFVKWLSLQPSHTLGWLCE